VTEIARMAILSSGDFGRWAFGIVPPRRDRHGRTGIVKGRSVRSDVIALIMSSYLASGIFGIYFANYYNQTRTHLPLNKDSPVARPVETVGRILPVPILGGLHHQYVRI
jgi:hypothetical protein